MAGERDGEERLMGHGEREIGDDRWTTERDRLRERCRSINGGGGRERDADM